MNTETKAKPSAQFVGTSGPPRVNYFRGMLLDEKDLSAEQTYQDARRRRLASLMHGCGILCGLKLRGPEVYCGQLTLVIEAGAALDRDGHLLEVEKDQRIRLADICSSSDDGNCGCGQKADAKPDAAKPTTYCVVLARRESSSAPKPVDVQQGETCGRGHEPSRVHEGWCVEFVELKDGVERCPVVPGCSRANKIPDACKELEKLFADSDEVNACACSACCDVVLGLVTVDCKAGTLSVDESKQVRRYAWTAKRLDMLVSVLCKVACPPPSDGPKGDGKDTAGRRR